MLKISVIRILRYAVGAEKTQLSCQNSVHTVGVLAVIHSSPDVPKLDPQASPRPFRGPSRVQIVLEN